MICEHGIDVDDDYPCAQCARAYQLFAEFTRNAIGAAAAEAIWTQVDAQLAAEFESED